MTHQQIQDGEIIERYVRHQLPPDQRRVFEQHYFDCDECFEQAQATAQFIASVRHSARRGVLAESPAEPAVSWWANWFRPAIVLSATAALLLAVALGWVMFKQGSGKHEETAIEQPRKQQESQPTPEKERQANVKEKVQGETPPNQNQDLAQNRTSAKTPTVVLDAARDIKTSGNQLTLPSDAENARFVIEVAPDSTFDSFQLQLLEPGNRPVTTIAGAKPNAQGTLVVKVAAKFLQSEKYLVRLFGVRGTQREMIAEYGLTVRKQ